MHISLLEDVVGQSLAGAGRLPFTFSPLDVGVGRHNRARAWPWRRHGVFAPSMARRMASRRSAPDWLHLPGGMGGGRCWSQGCLPAAMVYVVARLLCTPRFVVHVRRFSEDALQIKKWRCEATGENQADSGHDG
jgi:hypothetical protein